MQKHTKVYMDYFGYSGDDFIPCEVSGERAIDIHHISRKSHFGKKRKDEQDNIENLIALSRENHERAHLQRKPYLYKEELQNIHNQILGKN